MKEEIRAGWFYTLGKYFLKKPPILTLFVTSECNARCRHCFYWQNVESKKTDLPMAMIEKISRQLGHLELLLVSGGEPFLRKDLAKIVATFWKNNGLKSVSLITNGLLTARITSEVEKILRISPRLLVIVPLSLHGREKMHDQIAQVKGSFKKVQRTYLELKNLGKQFSNLRLRFNATVFNLNYEDLFGLVDELPELFPGADSIWNLSFSLLRGQPRDTDLALPSPAKLKALLAYKNHHFREKKTETTRFFEKIVYYAQMKVLEKKRQPVPCEAGRLTAVIDENGRVAVCEMRPPVGDLRKSRFDRIWRGRRLAKQRKQIVQGACYCTHECSLFPSLLAHPGGWPALLGDLLGKP